MKVLLLNTYPRGGGAAVAAHRLLQALRAEGVSAHCLTLEQTLQGHSRFLPALHRAATYADRLCMAAAGGVSRGNLFAIDTARLGVDLCSHPLVAEADVLHLHWVNQGFLSLKGLQQLLRLGKPVVWTMHDMWPVTGLCHHARACTRYASECRRCPYLGLHAPGGGDLSTVVFRQKQRVYATAAPITFVACSHWLQQLACRSALTQGCRVEALPNPIDTTLFCPSDKEAARRALGLPSGRPVVLFGSVNVADPRKGGGLLPQAFRLLTERFPRDKSPLYIAVGRHAPKLVDSLPKPTRWFTYTETMSQLVQLYNSADLFVTPSLEENLPNMIMEALACGTPCVGFDVGGIPELITHGQTGYVARTASTVDLAEGMYWVLHQADKGALSSQCRQKVCREYAQKVVAKQYICLYHELLNG